MREAGRALLERGPAEGARATTRWIVRWTGARRVVVWPAPDRSGWPAAWAAEGPPLPDAVEALLDRERLERWEAVGRDAGPEVERAPGGDVLLVPLWGTRNVIGAIVAELESGTELGPEVLGTLHAAADLLGIGLEVSARAEAARETERRLRRFLENLPDPAFVLDAGGRILDVSRTVGTVVGRDVSELVGRGLETLAAEGEAGWVPAVLARARRSGSARATFAAVGRRAGERRWLELHLQRLDEGRLLAVARDVTVRVRREHSLRVVLEQLPEIVAADGVETLWERLWNAMRALLPAATYMWVYRGRGSRVRMEWSSRPDAPRWEFAVRGWGPEVGRLLQQTEASQAFVRSFGPTEDAARRTLERLIEGRGAPLLLGDPPRQLGVFLGENELEAILAFWGDAPPGQLIHCPVLVGGRLELLVVVDAPPGERPFSYEDALFAWQLVSVAHQALGRLEAAALVRRQFEEVGTFREALREVGEAAELADLVERLVRRAAEAVGAQRCAVYERLPDGRWTLLWGAGIGAPSLPELPLGSRGLPDGVYLADLATDRAWSGVAGLERGSLAAIPLVALERVLGALVVASPRPLTWDSARRELLGFFADELSLALSQLTLKRRADELATLQEELLRGGGEATVVLDRAGRVAGLGGRAAELLGIASPALGRPLLEAVSPDASERLAPVLEGSLAGPRRVVERLAIGGRALEIEARPVRTGGVVWRIREVAHEGAVKRLAAALESVAVPAVIVDAAGRVVAATPGGRRLHLGPEEGRPVVVPLAGGGELRVWPRAVAEPGVSEGWEELERRLAPLADLATALAVRAEGDARDLASRLAEGIRSVLAELERLRGSRP